MSLDIVKGLVERFADHLEEYKSSTYNESQARRDFIDPFFEALGWDMQNKQGFSQTFRQVIHEDSLNVEGSTKAPDYCFQLGGRRVFFVEASKDRGLGLGARDWFSDSVSLTPDPKSPPPVFKAVYDCRVKPTQADKASADRVLYLPFNEYPARWDCPLFVLSP